MASQVAICGICRALVDGPRRDAHMAAHEQAAPTPPTRATTIGRAVGVVAWIFLAGCLAAFVAVVVKLCRWAVA